MGERGGGLNLEEGIDRERGGRRGKEGVGEVKRFF